jgi:hypothetical protein
MNMNWREDSQYKERIYYRDKAKSYKSLDAIKRDLENWQDLDKGYIVKIAKELVADLEKQWSEI